MYIGLNQYLKLNGTYLPKCIVHGEMNGHDALQTMLPEAIDAGRPGRHLDAEIHMSTRHGD